MCHGVPSDKKIQKGDFITMDFGAVVNGYHSDMTRTVAYGTVSEAQKTSLPNRFAGTACSKFKLLHPAFLVIW